MSFHSLRRMVELSVVVFVWALVLVAVPAAQAQDDATGDQAGLDEEARSLFEAGRTAFAAGRFDAALTRFRDAYELSGRPELLYNIGSAADRLRRDAEALEAFRGYLAARPNAPNRLEVESRIDVLADAVATAADARPQTTEEPTLMREPAAPLVGSSAQGDRELESGGSITDEWWFWTLIGVVVIGAGVGIGVGVAASSGDTTQAPLPGTAGSVAVALGAW